MSDRRPERVPTKLPAESIKGMAAEELTKASIRQTVWKYLESNNLASFPRPVYRRIPNFKTSGAAAEKLTTMEEFKSAKVIKVNPDKPQENVRFHTLEAEKTLLVPTPRLRTGLFNKIVVPEGSGKEVIRTCSTSRGVREHSEPLDLDMKVKVDLVVLGSVAVSKDGYRIGKGEGFGDLEYAMMKTIGAIDDKTIVISTVHESQVFDIPESIMQPHDVMVNYIVTPNEIIKCDCKRPQPSGIIWSALTPEKLQKIPVLKRLRIQERKAGKNVSLRDDAEFDDNCEDPPEEEHDKGDRGGNFRRRGPFRRRRFGGRERRRPMNEGDGEDEDAKGSGGEASSGNEASNNEGRPRQQRQRRRRPRFPRRKRNNSENKENGDVASSENTDDMHQRDKEDKGRDRDRDRDRGDRKERGQTRRFRSSRRTRMPTIFVGSIPRAVRVSELKNKVRDLEVNPIRVIWHGARGYAFFQFTKSEELDSALVTLQDIEISGRKLRIEEANKARRSGGRYNDEGEDSGEKEEDYRAANANED